MHKSPVDGIAIMAHRCLRGIIDCVAGSRRSRGLRADSSLSWAAVLLCAVAATPVHAALGGGADSVARDRDTLRGTLVSLPQRDYDIQEIVTDSGTVREYTSRTGGGVFAVTWRGTRSPDLKLLLGDYFDRYTAAATAQRTGRHVLSVQTPGLMVTVVRFQRYAAGQIYVPSQVPRGVTRSELR